MNNTSSSFRDDFAGGGAISGQQQQLGSFGSFSDSGGGGSGGDGGGGALFTKVMSLGQFRLKGRNDPSMSAPLSTLDLSRCSLRGKLIDVSSCFPFLYFLLSPEESALSQQAINFVSFGGYFSISSQ
jgi:hypothetical protein